MTWAGDFERRRAAARRQAAYRRRRRLGLIQITIEVFEPDWRRLGLDQTDLARIVMEILKKM